MGAAFFEAGRSIVQILSQLLPLLDCLHDRPSSGCNSEVSCHFIAIFIAGFVEFQML